jgi:hypothetical protein
MTAGQWIWGERILPSAWRDGAGRTRVGANRIRLGELAPLLADRGRAAGHDKKAPAIARRCHHHVWKLVGLGRLFAGLDGLPVESSMHHPKPISQGFIIVGSAD